MRREALRLTYAAPVFNTERTRTCTAIKRARADIIGSRSPMCKTPDPIPVAPAAVGYFAADWPSTDLRN